MGCSDLHKKTVQQTRLEYCFLALPNNFSGKAGLPKNGKMILEVPENGELRVNLRCPQDNLFILHL